MVKINFIDVGSKWLIVTSIMFYFQPFKKDSSYFFIWITSKNDSKLYEDPRSGLKSQKIHFDEFSQSFRYTNISKIFWHFYPWVNLLTFLLIFLKWYASSWWSFAPNSTCVSKELIAIGKMHPTLHGIVKSHIWRYRAKRIFEQPYFLTFLRMG